MNIVLGLAICYIISLLFSVFVLVQTDVQDKIDNQLRKYGKEGANIIGFVVFLLSPVVVLLLIPSWVFKIFSVIVTVVLQSYRRE